MSGREGMMRRGCRGEEDNTGAAALALIDILRQGYAGQTNHFSI